MNFRIYFLLLNKLILIASNEEFIGLEEPNEAEFYPSDDTTDDTCFINKEEKFDNKYLYEVNNSFDDLNFFNPEIEAQILDFAVQTNRKLLVFYILISKSVKQREKMISLLIARYGQNWVNKLKNAGSIIWKNSAKIMDALITKNEDFNSRMLNKRFEFLTKSYKKLDKLIPDSFKAIFKTKTKIFNSYMLTEILLETNQIEREKLKSSYFLNFKTKLEDVLKLKLSEKSSLFHSFLLNNKRNLPEHRQQFLSLVENLTKEIYSIRNKSKSKRVEKLIHIIGNNSIEVLNHVFKLLKLNLNYSLIDSADNSCLKMSTVDIAIKYLYDPYSYYAVNIKKLLDQKDFGYYLSRIFFSYPKQKLDQISKAFQVLYKVSLNDYIKSRLEELNPSFFNKVIGQYEAYETYLRALLASIGDINWCSGIDCNITQIEGKN